MVAKKEAATGKKGAEKKKAKPADGLPPCDKPHVAEASRNEDQEEACDDGVH